MEDITKTLYTIFRLGGMATGIAVPLLYNKKIQSYAFNKFPIIPAKFNEWKIPEYNQRCAIMIFAGGLGFIAGYYCPPIPISVAVLLYPFNQDFSSPSWKFWK